MDKVSLEFMIFHVSIWKTAEKDKDMRELYTYLLKEYHARLQSVIEMEKQIVHAYYGEKL